MSWCRVFVQQFGIVSLRLLSHLHVFALCLHMVSSIRFFCCRASCHTWCRVLCRVLPPTHHVACAFCVCYGVLSWCNVFVPCLCCRFSRRVFCCVYVFCPIVVFMLVSLLSCLGVLSSCHVLGSVFSCVLLRHSAVTSCQVSRSFRVVCSGRAFVSPDAT